MTVVAEEPMVETVTSGPCHHASVGRVVPVQGSIRLTPDMLPELTARLSQEFGQPVTCTLVNGMLGVNTEPPIDFVEFCRVARKVLVEYMADYHEVMLT